jgi:hypothetical protein
MTSSLSLYALPPTLLSPQETALKAKRGSLSAGLLLTALQPDRVLRVVHTEPVLLCTGDKEWRISKGWVALTVDGLHVLRGALEQQMSSSEEGPAPCQGQLRLTGRFTTEDGEAPPPNMLALFPLRDRVLYYLSAEGDLRRLSLLTGEHQPVVRGLQELQFTPERNGPAQRMTTTIRGDERELHFVRSFPHPPSLFDLL